VVSAAAAAAGSRGRPGTCSPAARPATSFARRSASSPTRSSKLARHPATPKDYDDIREVLRKLDVVPRQVLIEVLVAEVDLGDDLRFGIEHAITQDSRKNGLGRITNESTTTSGTATTRARPAPAL